MGPKILYNSECIRRSKVQGDAITDTETSLVYSGSKETTAMLFLLYGARLTLTVASYEWQLLSKSELHFEKVFPCCQ